VATFARNTHWGNLRANGHPNSGPWRQLLCIVCRGYFLETLGTIFHGKRVAPELIVRVSGCLAEGVGIRGTARVFEVAPKTVRQWLVEAADQGRAVSRHVLPDVRIQQVPLDELFALLSTVKDGEVSETEAIARLERSPQWVWGAMDPESKLRLALESEIARSQWRSALSTMSLRCWPRTAPRCFSPMGFGRI
jgi:hypothetical protein